MEYGAGITLISPDAVDLTVDPILTHYGHRHRARAQQDAGGVSSRLRSLAGEGGVVYLISFVIFLTVAVLLDFDYKVYPGDAVSRMANGFYIVYSRDPHLAAIGFVWTPLMSIADLVFLLGNHIWPALSHNDMAGSLTSVFAMAGAAHQIRAALREWGVGRTPRLTLTALFVLNPMILYYAGNGMSEALFLFTLTAATRYLLRWIQASDLRSLAYAAIALGFAYLTRNEAAAAIGGGAICVAAVSYWKQQGERRPRIRKALVHATTFAIPGVIAAVGWAVTTYVITGYFFGQFSSLYGNSQQQKLIVHFALGGRMLYVLEAIGTMWPTIPFVLVAALVVAYQRHDPRILAPLAVLGGALGFDTVSYMTNGLANYYRFFIATIPIEVIVTGSLVAAISSHRQEVTGARSPTGSRSRVGTTFRDRVGTWLVLVTVIPATIITGAAMLDPHFSVQESQQLAFIFTSHLSQLEKATAERHSTVVGISSYFGHLDLPNGDVIVDDSTNCVPEVLVTISQPKLFVIPNDRDFQRELADPLTFHAHFILEPNPSEIPVSAQNNEYPALWATGAGFTTLVHQFPALGTCPEFRLFKVTGHPGVVQ